MTELARKVLKNTAFDSSSVIIRGIGGLIFTIILARLLHPELFGVYHLALSVGLLVLTFTDLGIDKTLLRYVSSAIGERNEILARSYFKYLFKLKFFLAFTVSLTLILFANPIALYVFHKPPLSAPLIIVAVFIVFYSFLGFVEHTFMAFQNFEYSAVKHLIFEGLRLILVPLFILIGYSVWGALAGLSLTVIFAFAVLSLLLARKYPHIIKGETVKIERRRVLRFLGYLTFSSLIASLFFHQIDVIMLGILLTSEDVGFYKAAFNIVFAFIGLTSATTVLFPVFTQLEGEDLKNAFGKVFRYLTMFAFPCTFGLAFMANPIIKVVYGAEYLPAVLPFYVLCLIILITPMSFFGTLFEAKERPEYPAKLTVIASGLNVVLNYVFILKFGLIGAAIATVFARSFNGFALALFSKRVLSIFPSADSVYKPLISSLLMFFFLYFMPNPTTILAGIGGIIIAAVIYISTMFLIRGIEKDDIKYLSAVVGQEERLIKAYNIMNSKLQRGG